MNSKLSSDQEGDVVCRMYKIESIGNLLMWLEPKDLYEGTETTFYQNMGENIKNEAREVRKMVMRLERAPDKETGPTKLTSVS